MSRTNRPDVLEAMHLRRWALSIFGQHDHATAKTCERAAACSLASWDLFLRTERCALPLRTLVRKQGHISLPPPIASILETRATQELQRALSAVAQLRLIARIATDRGWKVIVLKGGVAATGSDPVDVQDVDILVNSREASALAQALDDRGHTSPQTGSAHHLPPRVSTDSVAVEIHHRLTDAIDGDEQIETLRDRATPLVGLAGLWRLAPADHLWHVITHSTLRHPDRRGRLRDLTLIEQAISQCTTDDLIRVEQCTDTHPTAALLKATLHTARTMREGRLYHDPFEQLALRKYTFYRQRDGHGGNLRERALLTLCRDHSLLQNLRADLALPLRVPSAFGPLNWLAPRARWLAGWTRQTLRIVRICVATGMAALSDIEARRLYKQWRETLEEQRWIPESVHAEE